MTTFHIIFFFFRESIRSLHYPGQKPRSKANLNKKTSPESIQTSWFLVEHDSRGRQTRHCAGWRCRRRGPFVPRLARTRAAAHGKPSAWPALNLSQTRLSSRTPSALLFFQKRRRRPLRRGDYLIASPSLDLYKCSWIFERRLIRSCSFVWIGSKR